MEIPKESDGEYYMPHSSILMSRRDLYTFQHIDLANDTEYPKSSFISVRSEISSNPMRSMSEYPSQQHYENI